MQDVQLASLFQAELWKQFLQWLACLTFSMYNLDPLTITWEEPGQPNGIITQYILSQIIDSENSTVLSADLTQSYSITDLTPFTTYSYYV